MRALLPGDTQLHRHIHPACARLQASPSSRPLHMAAHSSELLTDAGSHTRLAGQEVKASSKKAQDSAADTVERAQRELQEERGRSKRLLEAARAGSMATQSAGTLLACCTSVVGPTSLLEAARAGSMPTQFAGGALAWCCDSSVASVLLSGRCWHWMQCSLGQVARLFRRWSGSWCQLPC